MIDAVSTSPVSVASFRAAPRNEAVAASASAATGGGVIGVLRIRMDNQLDMAILEARSSKTGEVIAQFPSEAQIEAFQRTEAAERAREQQASQTRLRETQQDVVSTASAPQPQTEAEVAASVSASLSQPAPQAEAPVAESAPAPDAGVSYVV